MEILITYTKEEFSKNYSEGYIFATTMGENHKGRPHIAMFKTEEDAEEFLYENRNEILLNADDAETTTDGLVSNEEWQKYIEG